jgi:hypothetical protein
LFIHLIAPYSGPTKLDPLLQRYESHVFSCHIGGMNAQLAICTLLKPYYRLRVLTLQPPFALSCHIDS